MIIGVCGFAGSGKDTYADRLVERYKFNKISFAQPLKEMARIAFDFTDDQLYGPSASREKEDERYLFTGTCLDCQCPCDDLDEPDIGSVKYLVDIPEDGSAAWHCPSCEIYYKRFVTPRLALQTLGTQWGRALFANIWAQAGIAHIERGIAEGKKNWVISDCRFPNEITAIRDMGGMVVGLMRGERRYAHASEAAMESLPIETFDCIINNTGTLEEFFIDIDESVGTLIGRELLSNR